jgi:hypothetical protein
MNNNIKLTDEELKVINDLQDTYTRITFELGQIKIEKILLQGQIARLNELSDSLTTEYLAAQSKENEFAESIQKKYGEGEINIETGEFTPTTASV